MRPATGFREHDDIRVRLQLSPPELAVVESRDAESRFSPRRSVRDRDEIRNAPRRVADETLQPDPPDTTRIGLAQVPDPTVYAAADLDTYPRPLFPIELGHVTAWSRQLKLELVIDEYGQVSQVIFPEPVAGDVSMTALRDLFAGTRFMPARKNGRAVKSRVVLSVGPAAR